MIAVATALQQRHSGGHDTAEEEMSVSSVVFVPHRNSGTRDARRHGVSGDTIVWQVISGSNGIE